MANKKTTIQQQEDEYGPEFDYQQAMDDYKTGQKPILDAIMKNYRKPELPIDPEQEKKAKFGAALSDTFSSLAQMFQHGQGGIVQKREMPSATQTTNARLQAIKDKYDRDMIQYGAVKSNAELQDLNMFLNNARESAGKKREYRLYKEKAAIEADKEAERKRQFDVKQQETERHNKVMENKPTGGSSKHDKENNQKTVPVFVNNKQHQFPANLIEEVVARAIKDGVAGNITTGKDDRNRPILQKISPTSNLTAQQKQSIFQNVYRRYLQEDNNGQLLIRRQLSDYDKKTGITAQEKWKLPKTPANSQKSSNSDPLGIM